MTVLALFLVFPLILAALARLLGDFCEVQTPSAVLLGFCLGGALLGKAGVITAILGALFSAYHASDPSTQLVSFGALFSGAAFVFSVIALLALTAEIPARWLLRGKGVVVMPWTMMRTCAVIFCISGTLSWIAHILIPMP